MRQARRRPALIAGVTAVAAGIGAALALAAAGPGVPETHELGAVWNAAMVTQKGRVCEGTDGVYVETLTHFQAQDTESSDPRFAGPANFYLHGLYRFDGEHLLGHVDGTAHWYDETTGKERVKAKLVAVAKGFVGSEAQDGEIRQSGFIGGPSGSDDGLAYPMGTLPRGNVYATFQGLEYLNARTFSGRLGDADEDATANPASPTTGGIVQSFNCPGSYREFGEPSGAGTNRTTEEDQDAARRIQRMLDLDGARKRGAPFKARRPLATGAPSAGAGPLDAVLQRLTRP